MLIVSNGLREEDAQTIREGVNDKFYCVIGRREDKKLIDLIPMAENLLVIPSICTYCKVTASFSNTDNSKAVCRACREMEKARVDKMDNIINNRSVHKMFIYKKSYNI